MKKAIVLGLAVLGILGLAGCEKEQEQEQKKELSFVSADYQRGNTSKYLPEPMMKTEKGYYYYSEFYKGFRYYDVATDKEMYLCNKPECRHDGNQFCVATNEKYRVLDYCLYGENIMVYAIDETDTKQVFQVLAVALDGSELSEVATVMELEKTAQLTPEAGGTFIVHRNKVLLTMWAKNEEELGDVNLYGTALLDLDTKEVSYLDEEPLGKDNPQLMDISAYGDYFYYGKNEGRKGKKRVLHRYHIENGIDESYSFPVGYEGTYEIIDEDTVVYLRDFSDNLCIHRYATGETEEQAWVEVTKQRFYADGTPTRSDVYGTPIPELAFTMMQSLETDGTYLYGVSKSTGVNMYRNQKIAGEDFDAYIRVLDMQLNEIAQVDIYDAVEAVRIDGVDWYYGYYTTNLRFMGEKIYLELKSRTDETDWYVFQCDRDALIAGAPEFEFVCRMNKEMDGEKLFEQRQSKVEE